MSSSKRPVLILKTGETLAAIRARRGDFEDWFAAAMDTTCVVRDARRGLPGASDQYAAVVITGSASMVSHRESWSEAAADWLRDAAHAGVPLLGICYGHQLLAHALGGEVGPNPRGREIGSRQLTFRPQAATDPLLCGLDQQTDLWVQTSHEEAVLRPPRDTEVLATTAQDPHHVLRFGEKVWGLQFHPEFDADIMRAYLDGRRPALAAEGMDVDAARAAVVETPQARSLLARFAGLCGRAA